MSALLLMFALAATPSRPNEGKDFSSAERIRAHLLQVEAELRAVPVEGDSPRKTSLDRLHAYAERGQFPQQHHSKTPSPVFIDDHGVADPIAALMISAGQAELADHIHTADNHGYIAEMKVDGLKEWIPTTGLTIEELARIQPAYPFETNDEGPVGCANWRNPNLQDGPLQVAGFAEADMTVGRRACPHTEIGIGGRFGAIIDTPDFYGHLQVSGRVFGSYALRDTTEIFATLEAVNYAFAQNAVLTSTQLTLGNLTVGGTQVLYMGREVVLSVSARILLPTSFEIPGARLLGGELGGLASYRGAKWLEVHGYIGGDLTGALGRTSGIPTGGGTLLAGVQLMPFDWGALVIDLTGRLGPLTYLAPTIGLRFAISHFGIEVGGTLPLVGSDRHDFILGGRFSWRFDEPKSPGQRVAVVEERAARP